MNKQVFAVVFGIFLVCRVSADCPTSHFVTITPKNNIDKICFGTSTILTASGADNYYWLHNGETGAAKIVFPVGSRPYTVVGYKDEDGETCIDTSYIFITVFPLPDISVLPKRICIGETTTLTATGGIAYAWLSPEEFRDKTTQSITVKPDKTTDYSVSGVDANGCVNAGGATVTVLPYPELPPIAPQIMCAETETNAVILHGSPQPKPDEDYIIEYYWNVASNDGVTGAMAGAGDTIYPHTLGLTAGRTTAGTLIYNVTPHVEHCIGDPVPFEITVKPLPTVDPIPTVDICSGTSTAETPLTSTPTGASFEWTVTQDGVSGATDGNGASIPETLLTLDDGRTTAGKVTYDITPTLNGCEGKVHGTFEVNVLPVSELTDIATQEICSGGTTSEVTLNATIAGTTFAWTVESGNSSGASSGTGSSIPATTLTLNSGYTETDTVRYLITPTLGTCNGKTDTFEVRVNPTPKMQSIASRSICDGDVFSQINFSATPASCNFRWTVAVSGVSGATAGTGSNIPPALLHLTNPATAGKVTYTVTPFIGTCNGTAQTFEIEVNPLPTANISYTYNETTATVARTGQAGGNYSANSTDLVINPSTGEINIGSSRSGDYTVTYTFTDGTCENTTTTNVRIDNPLMPAVSIYYGDNPSSSAIFCAAGSVTVTRTGGTIFDGGIYGWGFPLPNLVINENTGEIDLENSKPGTYQVFYWYSDPSNPAADPAVSTTITILPLPTATVSPQIQKICEGEQTQATVTANSGTSPYRYIWTRNGEAFIDETLNTGTQTIDTLSIGDYRIGIIDDRGCAIATPLQAEVASKPRVTLQAEDIGAVCEGSDVKINVQEDLDSYFWEYTDDGSVWKPLSYERILQSRAVEGRAYRVSGSSAAVCAEMSDAFALQILPKPADDLRLAADKTGVEPGETVTFTLTTSNNAPYQWIENGILHTSNERVFTDRIFDKKSVQASISNGACAEVFSETVNVEAIYPTAITPYVLDGFNDDFLTKTDCRMLVFNRYGQKVYEGTNGWKGDYAGATADPGAYFYVLFLPDNEVKKGTVEVVRVK